MTLLILLGGGSSVIVIAAAEPFVLSAFATATLYHAEATEILQLNAPATSMMLHAEPTPGEKATIFVLETLTDQTGAVLVDQNGETLTAYGQVNTIVLNAMPTTGLLHAEDLL